MSEETLSRELEDAFRNRAHLYRLVYDELATEMGETAAERVLARAIERRGREIGSAHYASLGGQAAREIGERFLSVSPDGGRMYPTDVDARADGIDIRVRRCPLKDAWAEWGLAPARVATLCRIAGAFDKGLFESAGIRFDNRTWAEGDGPGCCHIMLRNAAA